MGNPLLDRNKNLSQIHLPDENLYNILQTMLLQQPWQSNQFKKIRKIKLEEIRGNMYAKQYV